jgi:chromosome segregation ATPase
MPLTQDEQKLDNSKAHLQKILGDIAVANEQLESIFVTRKAEEETLVTLRAEAVNIREESAKTLAEVRNKVADLAERESALVVERATFDSEKAEALVSLKVERDELIALIAAKKTEAKELDEELWDTADLINHNREYIGQLEVEVSDLETLKSERNEVKAEIDELNAQAIEDKVSIEKQITESQTELARLLSQLVIEKAKLDSPAKALREWEITLNRRERDIDVMTKRLKRFHEKMFPGKNIQL